MLTTIKHYTDFLIYYYNLSIEKNIPGGPQTFQNAYIELDHNLQTYPEYYVQGNYLVPDPLLQCFLLWWRDKGLSDKKDVLH